MRFGKFSLIKPASASLFQRLKIPAHIQRPDYVDNGGVPQLELDHIPIYTLKELEKIKKVNSYAKGVLEWISDQVRPGVTTIDLNQKIHDKIISLNAYPSPLFYRGFPASACTSVNNVICHGVPDHRPLEDGDIINIDITLYLDGFHGDTSKTLLVGNVDDQGKDLVHKTRECLLGAISLCGPMVPFSVIGKSIEEYVISNSDYSISQEFCGHGIGETFHQPPLIQHFGNDDPGIMLPGMVFTIEPILTQGDSDYVVGPDGWTVFTKDGGRATQFEHTILITENGALILTS